MAKEPKTTTTTAAPLLAWKVVKTPPGENTWKIDGVRAGVNAIVMLTEERAATMNKLVPDSIKLQGV